LVVVVTPERTDWTYAPGTPVKFRVTVNADGQPVPGVEVCYSVAPEMMPTQKKTASVPADGVLQIDGGTMNEPGFIRCTVTCDLGGRTYRGLGTAGFAPEKIRPTQTEPADFDAFWDEGKAALAKVPVDAVLTLVPEQCTTTVDVYHVSIRNVGAVSRPESTTRIYGMLAEPKAPGSYPAVLEVPGAGVRRYSGSVERAAAGYIVFSIGIHGIPVNLPDETYQQLWGGALQSYPTFDLDNRNNYYYRRVYLGCIRANDFLCSRQKHDGHNLIVTGGSQGGQLAIVTAALDPRVRALSSTFPAYCDVTGYLHGRAGGWPRLFRPKEDGSANDDATPAKIATTTYYDTVNFARRLKAPGFYTWGYNDETCPPTSTFAAFNVISAPKTLVLALTQGHGATPEQKEASDRWVDATVGVKKSSP